MANLFSKEYEAYIRQLKEKAAGKPRVPEAPLPPTTPGAAGYESEMLQQSIMPGPEAEMQAVLEGEAPQTALPGELPMPTPEAPVAPAPPVEPTPVSAPQQVAPISPPTEPTPEVAPREEEPEEMDSTGMTQAEKEKAGLLEADTSELFAPPETDAFSPERLRAEEKKRDVRELAGGIGEAFGDLAAFGGTGLPVDKAFFQRIQESADSGIRDLQREGNQALQQLGYQKGAADLIIKGIAQADAKIAADPNSDLSRRVVRIIRKGNPELIKRLEDQGIVIEEGSVSAKDVQDFLGGHINTQREIMEKEKERKSRKELATEKAEAKKTAQREKQEVKEKEEKEKWATKQYNKLLSSSQLKDYSGAAANVDQFKQRLQKATSFGDIANVFQFMKALDPGSVVRESEYRTAAEAGNLLDTIKNKWGKLSAGTILQPHQREQMLEVMGWAERAQKRKYRKALDPMVKQAQKRGIDPSDSIPYYYEIYGSDVSRELDRGAPESGEVTRRTKDGRTAVFNAQTKKFKRWAE